MLFLSGARRQRQPTGRNHKFNFRLLRDTLDFIYAQSSDRNIPVAQVIEEMADALKRQQARLGVPELTAEQGADFPFPFSAMLAIARCRPARSCPSRCHAKGR